MATHLLKLRSDAVTQETFDRLPALLTAFEVKLVTGFNDAELADAVRNRQIATFRRKPRPGRKRAYSKYTKASVAKIVGFRV